MTVRPGGKFFFENWRMRKEQWRSVQSKLRRGRGNKKSLFRKIAKVKGKLLLIFKLIISRSSFGRF